MRTKLVLNGLPVTASVEVRVADELFGGAGDRVGLGVGAVDAAQERSDITLERAVIGFRCADADVAGHVDRPPPGGSRR